MGIITIPVMGHSRRKIQIPDELHIQDDVLPVGKNDILFRILDPEEGDHRIIWDSLNFNEVRAAAALFEQLQKEGMVAHIIDADGNVTDDTAAIFDPTSEEVMMLDAPREVVVAPRHALAGG
jgi:hypothetical protein